MEHEKKSEQFIPWLEGETESEEDDGRSSRSMESNENYFQDFDPFPKTTCPQGQISWRGDPEEALSDWKIVLDCEDEEKIYHVH